MPKVKSVLAITIAFLLIVISIGSSTGMTKEELAYRPLTTKQVTQAFAQKGLKLESVTGEAGFENMVLFGIEPEIYRIQDTKDLVFIYPFSSQGERRQRSDMYSRFSSVLMDRFQPYSFFFQPYIAKNMFIVYCPYIEDVENISPEEYQNSPIPSRSKAIKELVFVNLNRGKTLIFRGEGQYWEAQTVYSYISQFHRDSRGVLGHEGRDEDRTVVRYKGDNPSEVGTFQYSLVEPYGSQGGTRSTLNSEGIAHLGGGGSSGGALALNAAEDTYTFTITWQGKSETFDLKVHPSGFALLPTER